MLLPQSVFLVFLTLTGGVIASDHYLFTNDGNIQAPPPQQILLDRTIQEHENDVTTLQAQGYRIISISAYGFSPNVHVATVWIQDTGPVQKVIGGSGTDFDSQYIALSAAGEGWVPTQLTCTGYNADSSWYAAVMEQSEPQSYVDLITIQRTLTQEQLVQAHGKALAQQQKLIAVREFWYPGFAPYRPQFCALWRSNPLDDSFSVDFTLVNAPQSFSWEMTKPYWRPSFVSAYDLGGNPVCLITTNTNVGGWVSNIPLGGETASDLLSADNLQRFQGRQLTVLEGFRSTSGASKFYGIWSEQVSPLPREWRAVGSAEGFQDNDKTLFDIDNLMRTFMVDNGVRQAQIAIGKNGRVLLERAYSWSEPSRYTTQPDDFFSLASVSKMFCAAAIQTLLDSGKLSLSNKPWVDFPELPWQAQGPGFHLPPDMRVLDITVEDLLLHTAGFNNTQPHGDLIFQMGDIARSMSLSRPPTIDEFVQFIYDQDLDFDPGSAFVYSNIGYVVLSKVVETVSGQEYFEYLNATVLTPLGLQNSVKLWPTDASMHVNDPITQESVGVGQNVIHPEDPDNVVAWVFGGDGLYKETAIGPSGLAASASTLVKFLYHYGELQTLQTSHVCT